MRIELRGEPSDYWAKLEHDSSGNVIAWHPLVDHCIDVGLVFKSICVETRIRHALAKIVNKEDLTATQIDRMSFLAAIHDFGKLNHGFQNRAKKGADFLAGHVREALGLINEPGQFSDELVEALRFKDIVTWSQDNQICYYLISSVMHHGKTFNLDSCERFSKPVLWKNLNNKSPFQGFRKIVDKCFSIFPCLNSVETEDLLPDSSYFQYLFSGLVCLADWIASDVRFFPFSQEGEDRSLQYRNVPGALKAIGITTKSAQAFLAKRGCDFSAIFDFSLYEVQSETAKMPISEDGSITILESSTGSGKTEACFARFLHLLGAGNVDGMYFALPTRTAATQIFERIKRYVTNTFPEDCRPPVILAVPGYLRVDDCEGRQLPGFNVLWADEVSANELLRLRGWASENPKRYLAGAILIGTIDQVLLSQLAVKHSLLRAVALQRLFLVVDEVHASDEYMNRILKFVLQTHVKSAGQALLMSATLGCEMTEQYLAICGKQIADLSLDSAIKKGFPFLESHSAGNEIVRKTLPPAGEKKIIIWKAETLSFEHTARLALEKAGQGARTLILKNTVKECIAVQCELEKLAISKGLQDCLFSCLGNPAPHHSRYVADDRKKLDFSLEMNFGKSSKARGCVVCATQTVQQSLDIDADFMITDLAPMDVLLQRIGRLHRHLRGDRNPLFKEPVCIVNLPAKTIDQIASSFLSAKDGFAKTEMGLGLVYENLLILEATKRQIIKRDKIEIPAMNRELIEMAMHTESLNCIAMESENFLNQMKLVRGRAAGKSTGAALNRFDWSAVPGENNCGETRDEKIMTRLGEGDLCISFPEDLMSAFGSSFKQINIPAFLAKGINPGTEVNVIENTCGCLVFSLGSENFIYDRLGLRKNKHGA